MKRFMRGFSDSLRFGVRTPEGDGDAPVSDADVGLAVGNAPEQVTRDDVGDRGAYRVAFRHEEGCREMQRDFVEVLLLLFGRAALRVVVGRRVEGLGEKLCELVGGEARFACDDGQGVVDPGLVVTGEAEVGGEVDDALGAVARLDAETEEDGVGTFGQPRFASARAFGDGVVLEGIGLLVACDLRLDGLDSVERVEPVESLEGMVGFEQAGIDAGFSGGVPQGDVVWRFAFACHDERVVGKGREVGICGPAVEIGDGRPPGSEFGRRDGDVDPGFTGLNPGLVGGTRIGVRGHRAIDGVCCRFVQGFEERRLDGFLAAGKDELELRAVDDVCDHGPDRAVHAVRPGELD